MFSCWRHLKYIWSQRNWKVNAAHTPVWDIFLRKLSVGGTALLSSAKRQDSKVPWKQVSTSKQPKHWTEQFHLWDTDQRNLEKLFWGREEKHQSLKQVSCWTAHRQRLMITTSKVVFYVALLQLLVCLSSKQALHGFMKCETINALQHSF